MIIVTITPEHKHTESAQVELLWNKNHPHVTSQENSLRSPILQWRHFQHAYHIALQHAAHRTGKPPHTHTHTRCGSSSSKAPATYIVLWINYVLTRLFWRSGGGPHIGEGSVVRESILEASTTDVQQASWFPTSSGVRGERHHQDNWTKTMKTTSCKLMWWCFTTSPPHHPHPDVSCGLLRKWIYCVMLSIWTERSSVK